MIKLSWKVISRLPKRSTLAVWSGAIRVVESSSTTDGIAVPLKAGEMSLHHTHTIHFSRPNRSDDRRIGYAVSYLPTHVRPLPEPRTTVLPVRGQDRHG